MHRLKLSVRFSLPLPIGGLSDQLEMLVEGNSAELNVHTALADSQG
jgi:hypothetical protein